MKDGMTTEADIKAQMDKMSKQLCPGEPPCIEDTEIFKNTDCPCIPLSAAMSVARARYAVWSVMTAYFEKVISDDDRFIVQSPNNPDVKWTFKFFHGVSRESKGETRSSVLIILEDPSHFSYTDTDEQTQKAQAQEVSIFGDDYINILDTMIIPPTGETTTYDQIKGALQSARLKDRDFTMWHMMNYCDPGLKKQIQETIAEKTVFDEVEYLGKKNQQKQEEENKKKEEAKKKIEEEKKKREEEEAKKKEDAKNKKKEDDRKKKEEEEEKKRKKKADEEEAKKKKAEEEAEKKRVEEDKKKKKKADEEAESEKKKAEEDKKKQQIEANKKAAEERRRKKEEEAQKKKEDESKKQEEEAQKKKDEKKKEEEKKREEESKKKTIADLKPKPKQIEPKKAKITVLSDEPVDQDMLSKLSEDAKKPTSSDYAPPLPPHSPPLTKMELENFPPFIKSSTMTPEVVNQLKEGIKNDVTLTNNYIHSLSLAFKEIFGVDIPKREFMDIDRLKSKIKLALDSHASNAQVQFSAEYLKSQTENKERMKALSSEVNELKRKRDEEVTELETTNKKLRIEFDAMVEEISLVRAEMESCKRKADERDEYERKYNEHMLSTIQSKMESSTRIAELEGKIKELNDKKIELENHMSELIATVDSLKSGSLVHEKAKHLEEKLQALQIEHANVLLERDTLKAQFEQISTHSKTKKSEEYNKVLKQLEMFIECVENSALTGKAVHQSLSEFV
jgi:hypothetical protein